MKTGGDDKYWISKSYMKPTIYKYGFIAFGRKIFESFFILAYFLDFIMNKQKKAQPAP